MHTVCVVFTKRVADSNEFAFTVMIVVHTAMASSSKKIHPRWKSMNFKGREGFLSHKKKGKDMRDRNCEISKRRPLIGEIIHRKGFKNFLIDFVIKIFIPISEVYEVMNELKVDVTRSGLIARGHRWRR